MGQPTLSGFLIGMVFISCMAALLGVIMGEFNKGYDIDTTTVNISKYDKLSELYDDANNIKNQTSSLKQGSGITDLVGAFFYQGYRVLVIIPQSFNLLTDMTEQAYNDANLGTGWRILIDTFIIVVIISLFLGIILAIILRNSEL